MSSSEKKKKRKIKKERKREHAFALSNPLMDAWPILSVHMQKLAKNLDAAQIERAQVNRKRDAKRAPRSPHTIGSSGGRSTTTITTSSGSGGGDSTANSQTRNNKCKKTNSKNKAYPISAKRKQTVTLR